jgi:hypothetical protein
LIGEVNAVRSVFFDFCLDRLDGQCRAGNGGERCSK